MCLREPSVESNQEEADTKVFLCASFAAELGYQKVRIVTVDSDIGILALYYQQKIDVDLLLEIGTGANLKIIDISTHDLPINVTDALSGLHAMSGCDTTSCFIGIGKKKCLSILESNERFLAAIGKLGESTELERNTLSVLEEYVCRLYSMKHCDDINKTKYVHYTVILKYFGWVDFQSDMIVNDTFFSYLCQGQDHFKTCFSFQF